MIIENIYIVWFQVSSFLDALAPRRDCSRGAGFKSLRGLRGLRGLYDNVKVGVIRLSPSYQSTSAGCVRLRPSSSGVGTRSFRRR